MRGELDHVYGALTAIGAIGGISRWPAVVDFIESNIADMQAGTNLRDQLLPHLHELRTFNEGDLLSGGLIDERLSVMTVHKAKGLEMDNVIVYDARELGWGKGLDRARVFYVAFSRAKKRLAVFHSGRLSEPVASVARCFERIPDVEVEAMALLERLHDRHSPQ